MTMNETDELIALSSKSITEKRRDFSALLDGITNLDSKKKQLWVEIYENAIQDRQNAYMMFSKLVIIAQDKSTEYAVHGKTLASYVERMSKANDQLIKLAELIADATQQEKIDPEDLYRSIGSH